MEENQTRPPSEKKTQRANRQSESGTWRTSETAESTTRRQGFIIHGCKYRIPRGIVTFLDGFRRAGTAAQNSASAVRALVFGVGLLQASLATASSQMPAQNTDRLKASFGWVEAGAVSQCTGALTLEPRGLDAATLSLATDPFLSAMRKHDSASADGGTLLGRSGDPVKSSEAPTWQPGANPRATFELIGTLPCLLEPEDAKPIERSFEPVCFGIFALILSGLFLKFRKPFLRLVYLKLSRSLRPAVDRSRARHSATETSFRRMASPQAE